MITASLLRRRSRMLVALLAIAVGATILSGLVTIYYDVPRQMGEQFRSYGANMIFTPSGSEKLTVDQIENAGSRIAGYPLFYGRYLGRYRAPHLGAKPVCRGRMRLSVSRREPLGWQLAFGRGLRRKGCRKDSNERVCQTGSSAEYKMQSALFRGLPGFQRCRQSNPRRSFKDFAQ